MEKNNILFKIDENGWCNCNLNLNCTNFDLRPKESQINLLIIHSISLPPGEFGGGNIEALFENRIDCNLDPYFTKLSNLKVSSHFLLSRKGKLTQFVSTKNRAWHAGISSFKDFKNCNDFSIGIELEGCDKTLFTDIQYEILSQLALSLSIRHPLKDIVGHEHVSPGRKTDPGPTFNWKHFQNRFTLLSNSYQEEFNYLKSIEFPK
tara:strand:- start:290 stop:907 length:618 start_codon:yes stop_codon:yes gene_type:complete